MAILLGSIASCSPSRPSPAIDKILLYEGLPHQEYEPEKLAEEKKKPTVEFGEFPFYRDPLPLKEDDAKSLTAILTDPTPFGTFMGEKKCGGFHPDYAIVTTSKGEQTAYLICFGCGEAKIYRPDQSGTRYEMAGAKQPLIAILKPYRKNRPIPTSGP